MGYLNHKHEMFLNFFIKGCTNSDPGLNHKHEMFLNRNC